MANSANTTNRPTTPIATADRKIKDWKTLALISGIVSLGGYIIAVIATNLLAQGTQYGWMFLLTFSSIARRLVFAALILTIVALVRVIIPAT